MTNNFLSQVVVFLAFSILMSVGSIAHTAIVVIDPGHGGIDRGGIPGQKLAEKRHLNLSLSRNQQKSQSTFFQPNLNPKNARSGRRPRPHPRLKFLNRLTAQLQSLSPRRQRGYRRRTRLMLFSLTQLRQKRTSRIFIKIVFHRQLRDAARAAATQSFLGGMDLSFFEPPPNYLAGMTSSRGLLGPRPFAEE